MAELSPRLLAAVDALPLRPGMRVLEVGGGPGAAAREVSRRVAPGFVLVTDRSARAVALTTRTCAAEIGAGLLGVRQVAVENLVLEPDEERYDLVFAVRVGALDGRHPQLQERALAAIAGVLRPGGRLHVDGEHRPTTP